MKEIKDTQNNNDLNKSTIIVYLGIKKFEDIRVKPSLYSSIEEKLSNYQIIGKNKIIKFFNC